ncbi:cobalamin biosynthesis protein [Paenibacillus sp. P25]|nr:cobalamin biosynthesis protein [Paenibacillus sp. P25]
MFYSLQETAAMTLAALVLDWLIGDPAWKRLPHPVILLGRLITALEKRSRRLKPGALARHD